jgi:DNA-directed RNA polymerase omega subunit
MPTTIDKLVLIEKITEKINNRYEAVRVMAKEARRLNSLIIRGAQPDDDFKPTSAAVKRVIEDKVKYDFVEHEETPDELFEDGD